MSRHADQIAYEIVQFLTVEPGTVIVGHQGARLIFDTLQFRSGQQMQCAVGALKLQRKVVFIPHNSCESLAGVRDYYNRSFSRVEIQVGVGDGSSSVGWRLRAGVAGKIGG